MKKVYKFNKIIYQGNIDKDFYFFCCKKNKRLYLYFFQHMFFYILSLISLKAEMYYKKTYYTYLKRIKDINLIVDEFAIKNKKKIKAWYNNQYNKNNLIVSNSPDFIVKPFLKEEKLIAPSLNKDFELDLISYNDKIKNIQEEYDEYFCNSYSEIMQINAKYKYIKKGHIYINYCDTKPQKILNILIKYLIPVFLAFILLLITFEFTTVYLDTTMISNYLHEPQLLLLNIFPILLLLYFLLFLTKRLWISFSITSIIIFLMGIANKTKLYYRDDVMKFEDITLLKEALIMTNRYAIIIRWYTVISIIFCIIIAFLLKKNYKKVNLKWFITIPIAIFIMLISIITYKKVYTDTQLYESVGNTTTVNIWIATRRSQIRGLIYPFIYSSTELLHNEPDGYSEEEAKKILEKYTYENIPEEKKVNIIAIMLEAYNDFSKFDLINFTEDVYGKLHEIEKDSLYGNIIVDIFGGGTISTERHFLTGYYDFPTFRKPTNSYPRYFKEQGYVVEAMHSIYGSFYNRNTGNYNLGFDNYWSYENRFNIYNSWNGFASDKDLYKELIKDLEKNKSNHYFNFTVTYQNHGPYSNLTPEKEYVKNNGYSEQGYNILNNYLAGIKSTNDALYDLVKYIDNYEEPTIIIFFGDHNPYLGENGYVYNELGINLDLTTQEGFENYYSIPYVIHANDSAKKVFNKSFKGKLETISPNYLMNEFFEYVGLKGNEYLQYTSDLKKNINVINDIYYKENNKYVSTKESVNKDYINEFKIVNYYWANNLNK